MVIDPMLIFISLIHAVFYLYSGLHKNYTINLRPKINNNNNKKHRSLVMEQIKLIGCVIFNDALNIKS